MATRPACALNCSGCQRIFLFLRKSGPALSSPSDCYPRPFNAFQEPSGISSSPTMAWAFSLR